MRSRRLVFTQILKIDDLIRLKRFCVAFCRRLNSINLEFLRRDRLLIGGVLDDREHRRLVSGQNSHFNSIAVHSDNLRSTINFAPCEN